MKLCVIGAGAAGLCAAKNSIDFGCEVTVFEQTDQIGGTWVYTDEVGKDKNGLDVHSSMYRGLLTNIPKEVMGYPTIPFPEADASYIPSEEVLKYYHSYADKFDLLQYIRFELYVVRVRPLKENSWEVKVQDMNSKNFSTYIFDAVLVCTGHYNSPKFPRYEGRGFFEGMQIHSHDFRSAETFRKKIVLIIGAGPSAMDAVKDCAKVAKKVIWSHHLEKPPLDDLGFNVIQKPDIEQLTRNGAMFVDGSYQECAVIIYCTGYKYSFPFLSVDSGVRCEDNYVRPLYKHCISISNPSLGFIGLINFTCPNQVCDLQVRFCLSFMTGRKQLPTKAEMLDDLERDMKMRIERGFAKKKAHYMGPVLNDEYCTDLAASADIAPIKPVISKLFSKSLYYYLQESTTFRNKVFKIIDDENFITES